MFSGSDGMFNQIVGFVYGLFFFLSFLMIGFFLVRDGKENVQSYVFTVISWQLFLIKTDKKLQMPVNHQFKIDHPVLDESLQIATCVYILYMFDY